MDKPENTQPVSSKRRLRRIFTGIIVVLVLLSGGAVGGVAWYFSDSILIPQPYSLLPEFEVIAADADTVTLPLPPNNKQFADTARAGTYNLIWEGGYGRLGEVLSRSETSLVRPLSDIEGELPQAGDPARLEAFIYLRDPLQDHGLAFEDVRITSDVGELHGWWLAKDLTGEDDVAVLMLHGRRRSSRLETLRIMPLLRELGYPVLSLAYRNHDSSPPSPDGFFHYGASEWRDALAGLRFLQEQGVERVVVYAYSMGGAVTLETIERWEDDLPILTAVIIDAALLEPRAVFELGATAAGLPLPAFFAGVTMRLATLRAGIDWASLDQPATVDRLPAPLLMIHGTADSVVPVSVADALFERLQRNNQNVRYERVAGAEHGEAWNQDPERYQSWIGDFLSEYAPLPVTASP
jgi:pimeloyl-ACP methyl ester carboxylesterase